MNPIYFPFTYISKPAADALTSCFRKVAVLQPLSQKTPEIMQQWAKQGTLELRFPVIGDEEKLTTIIRDYKSWIEQHQGSELSFFKTGSGAIIPFFDEDSTSHIRAELKGKKGSLLQQETQADPLLKARLFLQLSQEFDIHQEELQQNLESIENIEENLFKGLTGEDNEILVKPLQKISLNEPAEYMASERIMAWSRLMQYDSESSGVFITSSKMILESLLDQFPDAKQILKLDTIPISNEQTEEMRKWQDELMDYLESLAQNTSPSLKESPVKAPPSKGSDKNASLTFYLVQETTPKVCFSRNFQSQPEHTGEQRKDKSYPNTILGLIDPCYKPVC